jgi:hypothetical protein
MSLSALNEPDMLKLPEKLDVPVTIRPFLTISSLLIKVYAEYIINIYCLSNSLFIYGKRPFLYWTKNTDII